MSFHVMSVIKNMWPDFSATEKDFRNPSQEFLMKFYELFFDECALLDLRMQTPSNVLHQESLNVLHPESLNDTLPIISTTAFLSYISSHIKGPQFGLEDIFDPNPKKTWKLVENFTNYIIYVDCHAGKLSITAYENAIKATNEKEELTKETDEIKEKLNETAIRKAESASELKKLDNKVFESAELRDSVEEQYIQTEKELKLLNDALSEENHEMCALDKEIEKELEEIERLKEQIVSSPDTVSRTIAELSMKKKDMESDQAHLRNRAKQMMLLDSNLEQIASMIQSKLPQVDDLSANLIFLRDLEKGLTEDEAAMKSAKEKFDTLARGCQRIEMDCAHLEQEMNDLQVENAEKRALLEESIQQALKQKEEIEHKQIEHGAQQAILAQEICQFKEEIKDIERDEKDFIIYFNEMEDNMYSVVRMFKRRLNEEAKRILKEY